MLDQTPAVLVARYLRQNEYKETLQAFLTEAGLPQDTGTDSSFESWTIEKVLHEKKTYDLSLKFEKVSVIDGTKSWSATAPTQPNIVTTLSSASNILHVSIYDIETRHANKPTTALIATAADRLIHSTVAIPPFSSHPKLSIPPSDSPTLSTCLVGNRYLLIGSMSGRVSIFDSVTGRTISDRQDHKKYVVKLVAHKDKEGAWIASAAWDARILVYRLEFSPSGENSEPRLRGPCASIKLKTNPESLLWIDHPEQSLPILLASQRDSTFLYYYKIPEVTTSGPDPGLADLELLGQQNLAPHANAWISFTPCSLELSPLDQTLVALVTNSIPHMKLIVVRLLIPLPDPDSRVSPSREATLALHAQASLALQNREAAAITIECNTFAPQTPYSTPTLAWRPDGTGIWVNGDDGIIRGIELSSGKVVTTLKDGHEAGSKVRCLWAGHISDTRGEECLVSGGFDRKLIIWRMSQG